MTTDLQVTSLNAVAPLSQKDRVQAPAAPEARRASETPAADAAKPAVPTEKQLERDALEASVQDLNNLVQDLQRELRFSVDDESGQTVVSVVDRETKELLRQIPSEEVLQLRERMKEATGALFSDEA